MALSKGYVVASAGARGRTTKNNEGMYTGKVPAAIVDLKAAIRYLKFNDKKMPGDASKSFPTERVQVVPYRRCLGPQEIIWTKNHI